MCRMWTLNSDFWAKWNAPVAHQTDKQTDGNSNWTPPCIKSCLPGAQRPLCCCGRMTSDWLNNSATCCLSQQTNGKYSHNSNRYKYAQRCMFSSKNFHSICNNFTSDPALPVCRLSIKRPCSSDPWTVAVANGGNLHQHLKPQPLTQINTDSGWQWFLERVILSFSNTTVSDMFHMKERKKTSSWWQDAKVLWWLLVETRDEAVGRETFIIYCSLTFVRVSQPCSSTTPLSLFG